MDWSWMEQCRWAIERYPPWDHFCSTSAEIGCLPLRNCPIPRGSCPYFHATVRLSGRSRYPGSRTIARRNAADERWVHQKYPRRCRRHRDGGTSVMLMSMSPTSERRAPRRRWSRVGTTWRIRSDYDGATNVLSLLTTVPTIGCERNDPAIRILPCFIRLGEKKLCPTRQGSCFRREGSGPGNDRGQPLITVDFG